MDISDFLPGAAERLARKEQEELEAARIKRSRESLARAYAAQPFNSSGMDFAAGMAQQGFANHSKAIENTNRAWADEMKSRVAQSREAKRMAHEREMKKMELDAILSRLEAANKSRAPVGPAPQVSFPGGAIYFNG